MAESDSAYHTRPSLLMQIRDAQDHDAWGTFLEIYAPLVYRYCRRCGLQDADASDVAQEVLAQVARSVRGFDYQPGLGRFRDWLGTITRSKLADHHRARRRQPRAASVEPDACAVPDDSGDAGAIWAAEFGAHVLRAALERVRPHFEPANWRAFEMAWLEDRPAAEVARALGLPVNAVYVAKSRVLKRLREEVVMIAEDLPLCLPLG